MDNQKLILYIALSLVVMLIWRAWQQDYGVNPVTTEQVTSQSQSRSTSNGEIPNNNPVHKDVDIPKSVEISTPQHLPQASLKSAERIHVVTDRLNIEIDSIGGDLRQVELRAYPIAVEKPQVAFQLLSEDLERLFISQSGLLGNAAPNHYAIYTAEKTNYQLADNADTLQVPLLWRNEAGLEVIKTYTFHRNSYVINLTYQINNATNQEWQGQIYSQFQRIEPVNKKSAFGVSTYTGGVISNTENVYDKIDFARMKKENLSQDFKNGWLAMIEHYFAAALIPSLDSPIHAYTKVVDGERYVLGYTGAVTTIPKGQQANLTTNFYIGPKIQKQLKSAAANLELTVDYGKLTVIAQPIYWLLESIQSVINNWGWSIIILTIIIKAAFFHLSAASYKSMAEMRKLTPRIQAIKERYGDDRQKLNEAMMEIYRKEKINPLGGCLPILVQIPVFIALYWVLVESVELRQAPWLFWIRDLSAQDPYYVLPLIMGVTMFIQQKLSPAPPDPIQAKVMMTMPIVFTGMFLFFPSGLVLYWIVNNTLSISQQWYITNKLIKE